MNIILFCGRARTPLRAPHGRPIATRAIAAMILITIRSTLRRIALFALCGLCGETTLTEQPWSKWHLQSGSTGDLDRAVRWKIYFDFDTNLRLFSRTVRRCGNLSNVWRALQPSYCRKLYRALVPHTTVNREKISLPRETKRTLIARREYGEQK